MKKTRRKNLKSRMMTSYLVIIGLVFVIMSVMFISTTASLRNKTLESLDTLSANICTNINNMMGNIQTTSELLADDPRLIRHLDMEFETQSQYEKLRAMNDIRETVFSSVNRTKEAMLISGIYSLQTDQLFNFIDANRMDSETIAQLRKIAGLGTRLPDSHSRYWYSWSPLQDNVFSNPTGYTRQDTAITGSRWIYSTEKIKYSYIHFYSLGEGQIYDTYASLVGQTGSIVYILNENGGLVSSSEEEAVANRQADPDILSMFLNREDDSFSYKIDRTEYFVKIKACNFNSGAIPQNQWYTVLMVPKSAATQETQQLYIIFGIILMACVTICGLLLAYVYRQFMNPISNLSAAMERVDKGDLNAYAEYRQDDSETSRMIFTFNDMLRSINRTMDEQMALERIKKELDMQVLTNQINPHFLYNTLETIVWKAGQAGRPDIGRIASSLGKLYRLSISGGEVFVPLAQELEHLKSYIEIQNSRYRGRFSYLLQYTDTSLNNIHIPKIILQPIVENVFLYAIPEDENKSVAIRVTIKRVQNHLIIKVLDTGPGMDREKLTAVREQVLTGKRKVKSDKIKRRSTGIGLHNISARIKLYMGIEDALHIYSKKGWGTAVCIRIPLDITLEPPNKNNL